MLETSAHTFRSPVESYSQSAGSSDSSDSSDVDKGLLSTSSESGTDNGLRLEANRFLSSAPVENCKPPPGGYRLSLERAIPLGFPSSEDFCVGAELSALSTGKASGLEVESRALLQNFQTKSDVPTMKFAAEWKTEAEKRVVSGELSRDELTSTYRQINRLMDNASPHLSDADRMKVAAGILYHAGKGRIDQGLHPTCNVTVLQNIAFSERPSLAAEMITTAALEGAWKSGDGKLIKIPDGSLKPGWEEQKFPPTDGLRSHASQIFQVVALNDVGQREKEPKEYVQKLAEAGSILHALGSAMLPWSEYWMPNGYEVWKDASGKETAFQGLSGRQIQEESKRLFGDKYETIAYKSPYEYLSHPFSADESDYKLTKLVESENALRETLAQLKKENRLPVVVAVNGDNVMMTSSGMGDSILYAARTIIRPFKTLHEVVDAKLGIPNHVVTVSQYDAAADRVYIKNSWGKDQDGWMSVRDLWKAV